MRRSEQRPIPTSTKRAARGDQAYKQVSKKTGKSFPQDPIEQLKGARNAVFRSWQNPRAIEYRRIYDIPDYIGTAVNVQQMVFGNTGDRSATGVGFTRSPATGAKEFYGEFLVNAQGEDVVAGIRTPQPIAISPCDRRTAPQITTSSRNTRMSGLEFTFRTRLYMLQTRSGKRTGYAAVVIATDLVDEKIVTPKEAVLLVDPEALSQLLSPGFDPTEWAKVPVLAKGLPASPGAASGQVVFTADEAVEWTRQGKQVILVRKETVPDDIHGMHVAQGILTATGGMPRTPRSSDGRWASPRSWAPERCTFPRRTSSSRWTASPSRKASTCRSTA